MPPIGNCNRVDSGLVVSMVSNHFSNDFFRENSSDVLCPSDDSFVRASVLSSVLPKLEKLALRGIGGGARSGGVGQSSAVPIFKNSDAGTESFLCVGIWSAAGKPGLDCAVCARENGSDERPGLWAGVGGHSGFVGSSMGLEMLKLGLVSTEVPREDRDEGPLALMDSVSLSTHDEDREARVRCSFLSGESGGGLELPRWRGSMSPNADLKMRAASLSAIVR